MRKVSLLLAIAVLFILLHDAAAQTGPQPRQNQPQATVTPTDCPNPFVDISDSIFYAAIHDLNCRGIISGTDATHFSPTALITKAQVAKMLAISFNTPPYTRSDGEPTFRDVPPSYWAFSYIESVYGPRCGIAYCDYHFGPNDTRTRAQFMKDVALVTSFTPVTPAIPTFEDVPPTYFAYVYIETAYAHGIVRGVDATHFAPNRNLRRDEVCQIIYTALNTR